MCENQFKMYWWALQKKRYVPFTQSFLIMQEKPIPVIYLNCLGEWRVGILRSEHMLNVRREFQFHLTYLVGQTGFFVSQFWELPLRIPSWSESRILFFCDLVAERTQDVRICQYFSFKSFAEQQIECATFLYKHEKL